MDWITIRMKVQEFIKKYWYVALVLAAGLVLMAIPSDDAEESEPVFTEQKETEPDLQQELEAILGQIQGAGRVQVLLTEAYGKRTLYQADEDISADGDTSIQTVVITDAERNQTGLVYRVDPPVYLGAVVVCQGGDSAAVRLAIVEAVSNATGLGADKITVLKMK